MKDKTIPNFLLEIEKNLSPHLTAEQNFDRRLKADAVRSLMKCFCEAIERGGTPDRAILEYLSKGFNEFLDGKNLSVALGLTTKGRPAEDHTMRDAELAAEVILCKKEGKTNDEAFEVVSEKYPELEEDAVKSAYGKWRKMLDDNLIKQLSDLDE